MDTAQKQYLDFIVNDVLCDIDNITSRSMFGGYGIYKDGIIFAIIADSQLYFKVGPINIDDYKKMGSRPFVYQKGKHKSTTMSYWLVPVEILEDSDQIAGWVEKAVKAGIARWK